MRVENVNCQCRGTAIFRLKIGADTFDGFGMRDKSHTQNEKEIHESSD